MIKWLKKKLQAFKAKKKPVKNARVEIGGDILRVKLSMIDREIESLKNAIAMMEEPRAHMVEYYPSSFKKVGSEYEAVSWKTVDQIKEKPKKNIKKKRRSVN